jgi:hypothetical protein
MKALLLSCLTFYFVTVPQWNLFISLLVPLLMLVIWDYANKYSKE